MTLTEYTQLKQQIVYNVGKSDNHSHILVKLKDFYRDDIDSERRFEQISTIGQLLRILEIRDVLSEDNVAPLKEIARKLCNNELLRRICDYEANHKSREYVNNYVTENIPETSVKETNGSFNNHPFAVMSQIKRSKINETLVEEIGNFWRDLGRNLKIQEFKIDEIDSKHNNLLDKASELLNIYYEKKADPQRWFFVLCDALERCRRKDLSKSLQEIMTMNL